MPLQIHFHGWVRARPTPRNGFSGAGHAVTPTPTDQIKKINRGQSRVTTCSAHRAPSCSSLRRRHRRSPTPSHRALQPRAAAASYRHQVLQPHSPAPPPGLATPYPRAVKVDEVLCACAAGAVEGMAMASWWRKPYSGSAFSAC